MSSVMKGPILWEVEGKTYKIGRLQLGDFGHLQQWLKLAPIRELKQELKELGDVLTPEERQGLINTCKERQKEFADPMSPASMEVLRTVEGVRWLTGFLIRKCQEISERELSELFSIDRIAELQEKLSEAMVGDMDPTKAARMLDQTP